MGATTSVCLGGLSRARKVRSMLYWLHGLVVLFDWARAWGCRAGTYDGDDSRRDETRGCHGQVAIKRVNDVIVLEPIVRAHHIQKDELQRHVPDVHGYRRGLSGAKHRGAE